MFAKGISPSTQNIGTGSPLATQATLASISNNQYVSNNKADEKQDNNDTKQAPSIKYSSNNSTSTSSILSKSSAPPNQSNNREIKDEQKKHSGKNETSEENSHEITTVLTTIKEHVETEQKFLIACTSDAQRAAIFKKIADKYKEGAKDLAALAHKLHAAISHAKKFLQVFAETNYQISLVTNIIDLYDKANTNYLSSYANVQNESTLKDAIFTEKKSTEWRNYKSDLFIAAADCKKAALLKTKSEENEPNTRGPSSSYAI